MDSRRTWIGKFAGVVAAAALSPRRLFSASKPEGAAKKPRWGMVIDLDKCTGCGGCVVACRAENNVPVAGPDNTGRDRSIRWMDILTVNEGRYPDLRRQFFPTPCNHCQEAPCTKVCPVGATFRNEEGIVAQIWARCIGCRYCTTACPYTRRYFNWSAPQWSEEARSLLNPDVALRPKGVVEKCTFCHHRLRATRENARAEGRPLADADVRKLPACAQSCPADAITFGDLNDPESQVSLFEKSPRAFRLQEELGTHPKVIYLREGKWKE
ncbi:MAG: 4Fe-4S dicluster domain-containing protein [Planctomycetes bacterium]|nr:4Fe-4S dicluster domain-containing protein [Planctomycetota bacterium]